MSLPYGDVMTADRAPELHPDVAVLAPLLGTWEGSGAGDRHPETGAPMHAETGYLRVPRPGSVEIVMAQPTGLAEVYEGAVVGGDAPLVIDVRSTSIGSTTSAKEVTITERTISVNGNELQYTFRMAAVGQPLQHHLSATLRRS